MKSLTAGQYFAVLIAGLFYYFLIAAYFSVAAGNHPFRVGFRLGSLCLGFRPSVSTLGFNVCRLWRPSRFPWLCGSFFITPSRSYK